MRRWSTAAIALVVAITVVPPGLGHTPPAYPYQLDACPLDVVLVLDESFSMTEEVPTRMSVMQSGASSFLSRLDPVDDQSALVTFNHRATLVKPLSPDHALTETYVMAMAPSGGTDNDEAVREGHAAFSTGRPTARMIMVFVGDGEGGDPHAAADLAHSAGIEIYVIRVGDSATAATFQSMASEPLSTYYKYAATSDQIDDRFDEIILGLPPACLEASVDPPWCHDDRPVYGDIAYWRVRDPWEYDSLVWDWGDGTVESHSGAGSPPTSYSHSYASPGTYWITVTLTTTDGDTDVFIQDIYLSGCPVVDFTCGYETDPDWLEAWFRGVAVDPDDNIVSWDWDLGDGNSAGTEDVTHTYAAEGWYTVTLTVTDADGNTASATHDCFADGNAPPVISAPALITVYERETVAFEVTGGDPDGDPLVWQWKKDRRLPWHATIDMSGPREFTWTTIVSDAGLYGPIEFSVKDPYWPAATAETMIRVLPTPPLPGPENADHDGDGEIDGHDDCPATRADCETGLPPEPDPVPHRSRTTTTTTTTPPVTLDSDGDGVSDALDNCPQIVNRGQEDLDTDTLGDACDPDMDGDRVPEADAAGRPLDNCPFMPNPLQLDEDEDGVGDDCQGDLDHDGVPDGSDNCLRTPNPLQEDSDGDGVGDACTASDGGDDGDKGTDPDADVHGDVSGSGMAWAAWSGMALAVLAAGLLILVVVRRRLARSHDQDDRASV